MSSSASSAGAVVVKCLGIESTSASVSVADVCARDDVTCDGRVRAAAGVRDDDPRLSTLAPLLRPIEPVAGERVL